MGISAALFGTAAVPAVAATATAAAIPAVAATAGFISAGGLTAGGALTALGTLTSVGGAVSGASAARGTASSQAAIQAQQATRAREIAKIDEDRFRRRSANILASGRATGRTDPSALLLAENTAGEIELQAQNIRAGGVASEQRLRQKADITKQTGRQAFQSGLARGGSLLVQGAASRFA